MTEPKRRGRPPKKIVEPTEPEKPNNPDCEPATKGFVKHLIRIAHKTPIDISHYTVEVRNWDLSIDPVLGGIGLGSICWLLAMFVRTEPIAAWGFGIGTLVLVCVVFALPISKPTVVITMDSDGKLPSEFKKYTPKKDNCNEVLK